MEVDTTSAALARPGSAGDGDDDDAGASKPTASKGKASAAAVDATPAGKQRFEVKKVVRWHERREPQRIRGYALICQPCTRTSRVRLVRTTALFGIISVERGGTLVLGHCRGQLCHLPQPYHGPVHRMPGEPGIGDKRRMYHCLGHLQCMRSSVSGSVCPLFWIMTIAVFTLTTLADITYAHTHIMCTLPLYSTPSTFIAFRAGSRRDKCVRWITASGSFKSGEKRWGEVVHDACVSCSDVLSFFHRYGH